MVGKGMTVLELCGDRNQAWRVKMNPSNPVTKDEDKLEKSAAVLELFAGESQASGDGTGGRVRCRKITTVRPAGLGKCCKSIEAPSVL